jgi:hypothetical protein
MMHSASWTLRRLMAAPEEDDEDEEEDDERGASNNNSSNNHCLPRMRRRKRPAPPPPPPPPTWPDVFAPQTAYAEPHGMRMCTAVCYAVAHAFLMGPTPAYPLPSGARVDAVMRACHQFFRETKQTQPLMLAELQRWFPSPLSHAEVAGLTTSGSTQDIEDGPLLTPLETLLHDLRHRRGGLPVALLVTVRGHTWALLSHGAPVTAPQRPPLYLFDPLRDALCVLRGQTCAELVSSPLLALPPDEPYAGLMLSPALV